VNIERLIQLFLESGLFPVLARECPNIPHAADHLLSNSVGICLAFLCFVAQMLQIFEEIIRIVTMKLNALTS
jgi:hypothetical protein